MRQSKHKSTHSTESNQFKNPIRSTEFTAIPNQSTLHRYCATMNSAILLIVSLLVLAAVPTQAYAPADVCFTKSQKCCFKFEVCGVVKKKVRETPRCDFDKCGPVCKPVCKTVPKEDCVDKKVFSHKDCKKVCDGGHGYYYGHQQCHEHCEPQYKTKRVCSTKYVKKCDKVCKKVCVRVKARCPKTKVLAFAKFCPELKCEAFKVSGEQKKPADVVSKESKVVKVVPEPREIIGH